MKGEKDSRGRRYTVSDGETHDGRWTIPRAFKCEASLHLPLSNQTSVFLHDKPLPGPHVSTAIQPALNGILYQDPKQASLDMLAA